jgi:hypothetical protein
MIWQTSRPAARAMRRIRFCLLALVAMFAAHDAVFLAEFGFGDTFATVMRQTGHDAYWPAYMLLVGVAAGLLAASAAFRIAHLRRRLAALVPLGSPGAAAPGAWARHVPISDAPSYGREIVGLWTRLLAVVLVGFVLQENAEHVSHGHLPGLGVLAGPENPLALPALVVVTLLLAALGALVRWRIAVLQVRLTRAAAYGSRAAGLRAQLPAADWWIAATAVAHHWTIARQDPGRAPPLVLPAA